MVYCNYEKAVFYLFNKNIISATINFMQSADENASQILILIFWERKLIFLMMLVDIKDIALM